MNLQSALAIVAAGGRVRRPSWPEHQVLQTRGDRMTFWNEDTDEEVPRGFAIQDINADDYIETDSTDDRNPNTPTP
jgi:hypothetical protein